MTTAFRWYGPDDPISLAWIRQMTPTPLVVTHCADIAPGEVWSVARLEQLRTDLDAHQLALGPIESVFWTDAMKLGHKERDRHIENYNQTLKNLRVVFPDVQPLIVTYNLMPLDWSRTHLDFEHPNGARGLAFDSEIWENLDLSNGLFLPGWSKPYSKSDFDALVQGYAQLGLDGFWKNIQYALDAILPIAESQNILLAAHPNDPPWSTLGLPAVLTDAASIRRLLAINPSPSNALCFCTGSYSTEPTNNVLEMLREFQKNIAWLHLRTVTTTGPKSFHEADHADESANVSVFECIETLFEVGWDGIVRSDHGLHLFYETDLPVRGYPAIDRYVANKMIWAYDKALRRKK
jgi:mannonate dehydratase